MTFSSTLEECMRRFGNSPTSGANEPTRSLTAHPDVELLAAEQRAQEQEAQNRAILAARMRRRDGILAALNSVLDAQVLPEAREGPRPDRERVPRGCRVAQE